MKSIISWLVRLTARITALEVFNFDTRLSVLEDEGAQPVVISSATTPVAVTAAQLTKHAFLSNTKTDGAVVFTLPAAVAGMRLTAIVGHTSGLTLDVLTGDTVAGLATSGQTVTADALGESIDLICIVDTRWDILAKTGTWTAA